MAATSKLVAASTTYPYQVIRARLQVSCLLIVEGESSGWWVEAVPIVIILWMVPRVYNREGGRVYYSSIPQCSLAS